jgi:hypothetical protein
LRGRREADVTNPTHAHPSSLDHLDGHRFWVGVTGHRRLPTNGGRLRATILAELRRLQDGHPDRRMVIVSCLAEGADRLVARLALDHCDAELIVPLPLEPDEYAADFSDEASRREFRGLLDTATDWLVVSDRSATSIPRPTGEERRRRYAGAGAWIVEHCQTLIALWDGKPVRGTGGTGQVVEWMVHRRIPAEYRASEDPRHAPAVRGTVVHINPETCVVSLLP